VSEQSDAPERDADSADTRDHAAPYLLFGLALLGLLTIGGLLQTQLPLAIGLILTELVVILGVTFLYRRLRADTVAHWPSFTGRNLSLGGLALVALTSALLAVLAMVISSLMVELFPALEQLAETYRREIGELVYAEGFWPTLGAVTAVAVAAPVCEELLFRGTILPEQLRFESTATAVVVNGLLFGLLHANPMTFLALSLLGIFLAHTVAISDNIWPAILGHATVNTLNGVVLPRVVPREMATDPEALSLEVILVQLGVLLPVALLLWAATARVLGAASDDDSTVESHDASS
jgi:membrane protease YdiL (CAAX protease family)